MEQALIKSNQQMQEDLNNAAEFQRAVLPEITAPEYVDIKVKYVPYTEVSGDIYDVSSNREGELRVFLGDATGHGVAAALMTMMVQIGIDSIDHSKSPDEFVHQLNILMAGHDTGKFLTGVYFSMTSNGHLQIANAGHPPAILLSGDGSKTRLLDADGLPLGILRDGPVPYVRQEQKLKPGDKLIIYTDGVTEWKNEVGEDFGIDRLVRCLEENQNNSVEILLDRLMEHLEEHSNGQKCDDDLTVLGFQYR